MCYNIVTPTSIVREARPPYPKIGPLPQSLVQDIADAAHFRLEDRLGEVVEVQERRATLKAMAARASRDRKNRKKKRPATDAARIDRQLRRNVGTQSERVRLRLLLQEVRRELDWWVAANARTNPSHRPPDNDHKRRMKLIIRRMEALGWSVDQAVLEIAKRFVAIWLEKQPLLKLAQREKLWGDKINDVTLEPDRIEVLAKQFKKLYQRD